MRRLLLVPMIVIALVAASASTSATGISISITKTGFHPASATVPAGEAVTWTNNDTSRHQVVSNTGAFSSPVLAPSQSFSHVFRAGGTFAYHDGTQPGLRGSLAVIPARTVWITANGFVPASISLKAGETVTWRNRDPANHQIVADDGSFRSAVLARGDAFRHAFTDAGTFGYHDALQPARKGTVVVTQTPAAESITLTSTSRVVTYGGAVLLQGAVANGMPGEKVTINVSPQAGKTAKSVQTVTTSTDGSFTVRVQPLVQTVYVASTARSSTPPLAINVRPRLRLAFLSRTRGVVRASAAQSFLHRYGLVQFWSPRRDVWVSVKRVRMTRLVAGIAPTVVSQATFRLRVRHGLRVRVLMPRSQTRPGYTSGTSNIVRR